MVLEFVPVPNPQVLSAAAAGGEHESETEPLNPSFGVRVTVVAPGWPGLEMVIGPADAVKGPETDKTLLDGVIAAR